MLSMKLQHAIDCVMHLIVDMCILELVNDGINKLSYSVMYNL